MKISYRLGVVAGAAALGLAAPTFVANAGSSHFSKIRSGGPNVIITVTPDTGLTDGQNVNVSGTGYAANDALIVQQCAPEYLACNASTSPTNTNPQGNFSTTFTVEVAFISDVNGATIDCRVTICEIRVYSDGGPESDEATITFAGEGPPSDISLQISKPERIRAAGSVTPNHAGKEVIVKLLRKKDGVFVRIATRRPILDETSTYVTRFDRPAPGDCKVVARFPGDSDHLPDKASKTFNC